MRYNRLFESQSIDLNNIDWSLYIRNFWNSTPTEEDYEEDFYDAMERANANFNTAWNVYCDNLIMDGEKSIYFYRDFYNFLKNTYLTNNSVLKYFSDETEACLSFLGWLFSVTNDPEYDNLYTIIAIWKGQGSLTWDGKPLQNYL